MQHAIFCHQSRLDLWKIFKKVLLFNETLLKAANNEKITFNSYGIIPF